MIDRVLIFGYTARESHMGDEHNEMTIQQRRISDNFYIGVTYHIWVRKNKEEIKNIKAEDRS